MFQLVGNKHQQVMEKEQGKARRGDLQEPNPVKGEAAGKEPKKEDEEEDKHWKREGWMSIQEEKEGR